MGKGAAAIFFLSLSLVARANPVPESKLLFRKALVSMRQFMPGAFLAVVNGKLPSTPECSTFVEWQFVFQTETEKLPAAGGFVRSTALPHAGGCQRKSEVVVDTDLAQMAGYTFLVKHGNLDDVKIEWQDAEALVERQHPGFTWAKTFQIYSPLIPVFSQHVYYQFAGTLDGDNVQFTVDASSGDVT